MVNQFPNSEVRKLYIVLIKIHSWNGAIFQTYDRCFEQISVYQRNVFACKIALFQ